MRTLVGLLFLLLAAPAAAFEGAYHVTGSGPAGSYEGSARIAAEAGGRFTVLLRTFEADGAERRLSGRGPVAGAGLLVLSFGGERDGVPEAPTLATLVRDPAQRGAWEALYRDARGELVRRERWVPDSTIRIPLCVVALTQTSAEGPADEASTLPGVSRAQAREAQDWIQAQLDAVYAEIGVRFQVVSREPLPMPGQPFDRDRDGMLSRSEVEGLRDELAWRGLKRPGRVVVVVTAAELVGAGCRGWTLGDAPATPHTLTDPNDNFSLVGLAYLDPTRFHTVAHEVGHQLGLDDVGRDNRPTLTEPQRDDHLMVSGGIGLHLDPRVRSLLRRTISRFPDHGLTGTRHVPVGPRSPAPGERHRDGLPTPAPPHSALLELRTR